MELRDLRYVVAVAEAGNFTRAAEAMKTSQQNLSKHIRALEEQLGVRLFERTPAGVTFTPAGRVLVERGRLVLSELQDTVQQVQSAAAQVPLRLGFTFLEYALFPEVEALFPLGEVSPHPVREFGSALVRMVQAGQLDLAFLHLPVTLPDGVQFRALRSERMGVIMPEHDTLAQQEVITFEAWSGRTTHLASHTAWPELHRWLESLCRPYAPPHWVAVRDGLDIHTSINYAQLKGELVACSEAPARMLLRQGIVWRPLAPETPLTFGVAWLTSTVSVQVAEVLRRAGAAEPTMGEGTQL